MHSEWIIESLHNQVSKGDTIQDMSAEHMPFRNQRMVKIIRGIMLHAQFLHHPARPLIEWRGKGEDFCQPQDIEAILQGNPGSFGRVALLPILSTKPPTNFDTGREAGSEARITETDKPSELRDRGNLDSPEAKAMLGKVSFDPIHHGFGLCDIENGREEFHHHRISIDRSERSTVTLSPGSQQKPGSGESVHVGYYFSTPAAFIISSIVPVVIE